MKIENSKNNPLVSIIVPCYNHERYVTTALSSILEDTYPFKEIVIIDDGSKDGSVECIKKWIEDNNSAIPIIFKYRKNEGFTATLNELISLANGKYVVPLASDDLLINNTISERVDLLENNNSKMVIISDARVIDSNGDLLYESMMEDFHKTKKNKYQSDKGILNEIIFNFAISGPVVFIDKNIYKLIGKYPENLKAEDLYFYIKSACLNKILFFDKKVCSYRIHSTNTSGVNPELSKTVILTYLKTLKNIPGIYTKIKVLKRIAGIYYKMFSNKTA
ncbi:glycosyltransferase [Flavobacterium sp. 245]|uniref:glycosyltransferase n=1 Tax=Flavobacterium sp. 245 TaxID=2512115 RepID=UPI00105E89C3|nr:glycosyltransferase [Flavobacterium sp. 245]TDP00909.1 glycosyl transferase family 2 [Flavobacterium sp. 245]